ncbi:MAG: hypothetical protein ACYCXY_12190 [Acidimicrobiales bacterium]
MAAGAAFAGMGILLSELALASGGPLGWLVATLVMAGVGFGTAADRSRTRRIPAIATTVIAQKSATSARIARSLPEQRTPDLSPIQNAPKLVSMMPTPVFMVFSGTSDSCRATTTPSASRLDRPPPPAAASSAAVFAQVASSSCMDVWPLERRTALRSQPSPRTSSTP